MYTVNLFKYFLPLFFFCSSVNLAFSQADLCNGCYVWSFTNDKGERDETTRLLTDAVEDIISQYPSCILLQRSRFAKLQEQIANEKAIQSLNSAPSAIKDELKVIQAKRVIFGSVSRDFQGSVSLRLTFESLTNSQFKSNTIFLTGEDYYNFDKRKEKLTAFVNSFINPDGKMVLPPSITNGNSNSMVNKPKPISAAKLDNLIFELLQCKQNGQIVKCQCQVTSEERDVNLSIMGEAQTRIFDAETGREFYPINIVIGGKRGGGAYSGTQKTIVAGFPVSIDLEFGSVNIPIKTISKLDIRVNLEHHGTITEGVAFRNISVGN